MDWPAHLEKPKTPLVFSVPLEEFDFSPPHAPVWSLATTRDGEILPPATLGVGKGENSLFYKNSLFCLGLPPSPLHIQWNRSSYGGSGKNFLGAEAGTRPPSKGGAPCPPETQRFPFYPFSWFMSFNPMICITGKLRTRNSQENLRLSLESCLHPPADRERLTTGPDHPLYSRKEGQDPA